jgi:hypothetical protein
MNDDLQTLTASEPLLNLLTHYAERSAPDRQAWHERLMRLDRCESRDLSKLHGKLIAFGWVEQNTGVLPSSYRATRAGMKALDEVRVA